MKNLFKEFIINWLMSKIKNRHILGKKDITNIIKKTKEQFDYDINFEKSTFESGIFDDKKLIFIDEVPCFVEENKNYYFTMFGINKFKLKNNFVIVDMGAVKFVINGADIMTPGIVDADPNIKEGDQVWICDQRNKKILATGIALIDGEMMKTSNKGKAIKSRFYVGDLIWNSFAKSL